MSMPTNPERTERDIRPVRAAGGVVCRREKGTLQVLLIHRNGVWDLPKGMIEPGESAEEGSCREVEEETGCGELSIIGPLGTTVHHYEQGRHVIEKTTWWYTMVSGRPALKPQREEGIEALEWTDLAAAPEKVGYKNLKTVLNRVDTLDGLQHLRDN
ncbi:MAG: NUDIX hydrolase [Bacteroidota bacterium]